MAKPHQQPLEPLEIATPPHRPVYRFDLAARVFLSLEASSMDEAKGIINLLLSPGQFIGVVNKDTGVSFVMKIEQP